MTYTIADLDLADRHVREGTDRVARLREQIAKSEREGRSTTIANASLTTMLTTLDLMLDHQRAIAATLGEVRPAE